MDRDAGGYAVKPMWMTNAAGMVYWQPGKDGKDTRLLVDVYGTHVRLSGDILLSAENMECLADMLMEGARELRSRQRSEQAVTDAFRKALGL